MKLDSYLYLKELLKSYKPTHQELREFALKHREILESNYQLISQWLRDNLFRVDTKPIKQYLQISDRVELIIILIAIFMGAIAGWGLLSYSGKEPVNIVYFLLFSFVLPLLTGVITLYSLFGGGGSFNPLISSLWRYIFTFFDKSKESFNPPLPSRLIHLKFIELSIKFSLSFYLALGAILVVMVVGEDIAFGWRTTLKLSNEEFYQILKLIASPWSWLDFGVPSKELIASSHYFRLGGVDSSIIQNASALGEWWKFLFMSIVLYGVIFRVILLIIAKLKFKKELKDALLNLEGVQRVLLDMQRPFISTQTTQEERPLTYDNLPKPQESSNSKDTILNGIGWGFQREQISFFCELFEFDIASIYEAGGAKSLAEDMELIEQISKEAIIFIKSWEAPTMDFFDFVEDLLGKGVDVSIYPIGLESNSFVAKAEDIKIWQDKLLSLNIKIKIREPKNG